eukprot:4856528-Amphidinium_carterae.1
MLTSIIELTSDCNAKKFIKKDTRYGLCKTVVIWSTSLLNAVVHHIGLSLSLRFSAEWASCHCLERVA